MKIVSPAVAAALSMVALSQSANANRIVNGDFESGYANFGSDYFFVGQDGSSGGSTLGSPSLQNSGTFVVSANANNWHPNFDSLGDHTTGEGQMLVANGSESSSDAVWRQFVNIDSVPRGGERFFEFTFWARTVFPSSPPNVRLLVDGESVGADVQIPESNQEWHVFTVAFDWSVPVGSRGDGFALSLIDLNTAGFGNDFAIDDLSLIEVPGPGAVGVMLVGAGFLSRRRRVG